MFRFADGTQHWSQNPTKYELVGDGPYPGNFTVTGHGRGGGRAIEWTDTGWGLQQPLSRLLNMYTPPPTDPRNSMTMGAYVYCSTSGPLVLMQCGDISLVITDEGRIQTWYKFGVVGDAALIEQTGAGVFPMGTSHCIEWQVGNFPTLDSPNASVVMLDEVQTAIGLIDPRYVHGDITLGPAYQASGSIASVTLAMTDIYIVDRWGGGNDTDFRGDGHTRTVLANHDQSIGFFTRSGHAYFYECVDNLVDPSTIDWVAAHNLGASGTYSAFTCDPIPLTEPNERWAQPFIAASPVDPSGTQSFPYGVVGFLNSVGGGGTLAFPVPRAASSPYPYLYAWYAYGVLGKDYWNGTGVGGYLGVVGPGVEGDGGMSRSDCYFAQCGVELYWMGNPGPYTVHLPPKGRSYARIVGL